MRHRHDRDVDAGELADLLREHAAGVDDDLGLDLAFVRLDAGTRPRSTWIAGHARLRRDLRAAAPRALGQRERELAGSM